MKKITFITLVFLCFQLVKAQKASDVLENGIPIKTNEKLFLHFESKILKYDVAKSIQDPSNPPNFITLKDSIIFLASKDGLNVYLRPLNPLNYSYNSENKVIVDPINEAALTALTSIIGGVEKINLKNTSASLKLFMDIKTNSKLTKCDSFVKLENRVKLIQTKLSNNRKSEIIEIFKKLKSLDFADSDDTKSQLTSVKVKIKEIEDYFYQTDTLIVKGKEMVENYNCDYPEAFTTKYIFNSILKDLSTTLTEQKTRVENLKKIHELLEKVQQTASVGGGADGLRWCLKLDEIPVKEGNISVYTITINESGYILSDKDEIVKLESKEVLKRTLKIRKFQRFVPEVSVGLAYTFLKYYTYGTTSDASGQQYVAPPTENEIKNLNITTMLNYNYYIPHSNIHPFYQIGFGINSEMPTLLTGLGLRSNVNGIKRLTISGGIAMTWLRELETLKVGDKITGTADIENDYKYSSAPEFTPYVGIQYNF